MIDHHVTSLQLSKRLKELGVPQESLFYWNNHAGNTWSVQNQKFSHSISAFLASELMDFLPLFFGVQRNEDGYSAFDAGEGVLEKKRTTRKTMADSLAKTIIHLIESGIIDPKTLKKENL